MLTQASTDKSNEALIKLLTDKDQLKGVKSQMQGLHPQSNIVHPVAASLKANVGGLQLEGNVLAFLCQSKVFFLVTKFSLISTFRP